MIKYIYLDLLNSTLRDISYFVSYGWKRLNFMTSKQISQKTLQFSVFS